MRAVVARKVIHIGETRCPPRNSENKEKENELNILRWTRCGHSVADDGRGRTGALATGAGGRAVALCEVGTDGLRLDSLPDEQRQCNHRRRLE